MPTMPNVVGLELPAAQKALESAGVLVLSSIGYFGTWPITVNWQSSTKPASTVLTQSPSSGATVAANAAITLSAAEFPMGVSYP